MLTKSNLPGQWGSSSYHSKNHVTYKSRKHLQSIINDGNPISACIYLSEDGLSQKTYTICKTKSGDMGLFEVLWNSNGEYKFGLWCAQLEISDTPQQKFNKTNKHLHSLFNDNVIIAPMSNLTAIGNKYCGVTSNWIVHEKMDTTLHISKMNVLTYLVNNVISQMHILLLLVSICL